MPPKKNEPGKKTVEKKKEKVIEVNLLTLCQTCQWEFELHMYMPLIYIYIYI